MNFDHILLRLKQQLGSATDKEVAELLGLSKTAFAERKRRDAFPREKLMALAGERPDLHLNITYILTGVMPSMDEQEKIQASIVFIQNLPAEERGSLMQKLQDGITENTAASLTVNQDELELLLSYRGCSPEKKKILRETAKAFRK